MPQSSSPSAVCKQKDISKKRPREDNEKKKDNGAGGLNEIDALFDSKRQQKKQQLNVEKEQKKAKKQQQSNSSRDTLLSMKEQEWRDDGLGGKYNHEGYTGRKEDGVKVFKAHLLNKPDFGTTKDCPFDCNCCFI
jgi:hypothetical protein